jgi:hypothetical protein
MTYSFGEVAWGSEVEIDKKPAAKTSDLYMRLKDGDNELRIVTPMYQYTFHKYKPNETDKGYGTKIRCSATKENGGNCALCKAGEKVSLGWYIGVIDRASNSYKILSMSKLAMTQLLALVRNIKHWGDPTKYDINIIQNPNGGPTAFYNVQGIGKSPLSPEDQVLKDKADLEFLKARVVPPTPEDTLDKMNKVLSGEPLWLSKEEFAAKNKKGGAAATPAKKKTVVPVVADDEEFEEVN